MPLVWNYRSGHSHPYQLTLSTDGSLTAGLERNEIHARVMSARLFWAAMVQAFRFVFGNNDVKMMEAIFVMMQNIIRQRVVVDFDYSQVMPLIKQVRADAGSGLSELIPNKAMETMDARFGKYADRDRINEANLHSEQRLLSWLTMSHDMLKDIAVKIMTLYMAILTSGEMGLVNTVQSFMDAFRRQYGNVWCDFDAIIRRMIRFVAPQWVDAGNMALSREYIDRATAHFTDAVNFLYGLFDMNAGTEDYRHSVLMRWIRSLYNYLNFIETFKNKLKSLNKYDVVRCMQDMMGSKDSFMHRITNQHNVQEQIDVRSGRRR